MDEFGLEERGGISGRRPSPAAGVSASLWRWRRCIRAGAPLPRRAHRRGRSGQPAPVLGEALRPGGAGHHHLGLHPLHGRGGALSPAVRLPIRAGGWPWPAPGTFTAALDGIVSSSSGESPPARPSRILRKPAGGGQPDPTGRSRPHPPGRRRPPRRFRGLGAAEAPASWIAA